MILLLVCSAAGAGDFSAGAPVSPIQYQLDSRTRTDDRRPRPQRYVCGVPPRESDNRNRPYVCRADAGRV
ncbi:hypothetical protein, partial [Stenotrophomonas sp. GbtcB23]|uniref:hypothetical protein n=1 Tax=Stenotrophomonas sp. GbtcB23 TaxID=2824768 RepID=UPI001C308C5B